MCGHWWNHWNWNIVVLNVVQSTNSFFLCLSNCFHLNFISIFFFNKIPSEIRNRFISKRGGMEKKRFQWQSKRRNLLLSFAALRFRSQKILTPRKDIRRNFEYAEWIIFVNFYELNFSASAIGELLKIIIRFIKISVKSEIKISWSNFKMQGKVILTLV
jgi:hypothetical protein